MKLIGAWWRRNREIAPTLFDDELDEAIGRLVKRPLRGAVHEVVGGKTFRRILLRRTKQHVFYVVDDATEVIVIHTIWGARRGRVPTL
jgi:hypothetical protein